MSIGDNFGGVILQGAGTGILDNGLRGLSGVQIPAVVVTMGKKDSNRGEIKQLQATQGDRLQVFEFEGGHQWAPKESRTITSRRPWRLAAWGHGTSIRQSHCSYAWVGHEEVTPMVGLLSVLPTRGTSRGHQGTQPHALKDGTSHLLSVACGCSRSTPTRPPRSSTTRSRRPDGKKVATGFSGGARACSLFVTLVPGFGGLIFQGAGCARQRGRPDREGVSGDRIQPGQQGQAGRRADEGADVDTRVARRPAGSSWSG